VKEKYRPIVRQQSSAPLIQYSCFYSTSSDVWTEVSPTIRLKRRDGAALVTGRLDYCNGVLAGIPLSTFAPLQLVQNAAARLLLGLRMTTQLLHYVNSLAPSRLPCAVQTLSDARDC